MHEITEEIATTAAQKILDEFWKNKLRENFFPKFIDALNLERGVEIGTDEGKFAYQLLFKSKLKSLWCVDTWQDGFGSDFRKSNFDDCGDVRFEKAQVNLLDFKKSDRCGFLRTTSVDAASKFAPGDLDFVYIDGDHTVEGVLDDLKAWTSKVQHGIIAGHDYKNGGKNGCGLFGVKGNPLPYGVKTAVNYWCSKYGYQLHVVGRQIKSWWFLK